MLSSGTEAQASQPYASEPVNPSTLALHRRNSKLAQLGRLRELCTEAAGVITIDYELDQIGALIRDKALDEAFSVAVRERWQNWSRNANPFRTELASSAASELRSTGFSESDSDDPSEDSAAEVPSEPEEGNSSRKRKRKHAFRATDIKMKAGTSELDVTQGWEVIRRDREAHLRDFDAALPSAFCYDERQLQVYAHRLKPKYINSLDRPFEIKDIHKLLRPSWQAPAPNDAQGRHDDPTQGAATRVRPVVFTISFFSSSLGLNREDAAGPSHVGSSNSAWNTDGDRTRDDYVKRICGDGLGGMRRSQTVELLSTHTLSDLQDSLVCWSDGQPERCDWRRRLRKDLSRFGGAGEVSETMLATDPSSTPEDSASERADPESDQSEDHPTDTRYARFTGARRRTDAALIIEAKLYSKGIRHGAAAHEADYATLLDQWRKSTGHADAEIGWTEIGGDLNLRLDQLKILRVGRPYWMLHQGDCIHSFVIDQVRALRPSEDIALQSPFVASSVETAPAGTAFVRFPRVTWLSSPAMLRFAADNKDNYGLGHRILHWDGLLPLYHSETGPEAGPRDTSQIEASALQIAMGRTKRKDEGLVRKKQGKCLACSLRKARVGILGGDRVRLPTTLTDQETGDASVQDDAAIDGLDDHLTTVCTSCAALLGLPTRTVTTEPNSEGSVELDWQRIDREKGRHAEWTVFPMY